jgi:DNA (cytosine-5)-methyltransferase 1
MDLFAGCGGLSLGLMMAGWNGLLAVEKDSLAFETLKFNLIDDGHSYAYDWPAWFEKKHCSIGRFVGRYRDQIKSLNGKVTLIAGGPPCQSFSLAGRRDKTDPRNHLFKAYVDIVSLVRPKILLLENVHGIAIAFDKKERSCNRKPGRRPKPYSVKIKEALEEIGYRVYPGLIRAVDHGVPQFRPRYIMFGIDASLIPEGAALEPFSMLDAQRKEFLGAKGLPVERPVTTREAISDLETAHIQLVDCVDCPGFRQIAYTGPSTFYQQFLHGNLNGVAPNSLRLANHRKETVERFRQILSTCRHGVQLSKEDRERFGLKKHCTVPLDGDKPCHTLTTLPDDLLHYAEPRILTVREFARLQSFPDWFQFKGKYTTGGDRRVKECPRYTQVGNAVPPLLAEALGRTLTELLCRLVPSPSIRGRRAKHGMVGNGSR